MYENSYQALSMIRPKSAEFFQTSQYYYSKKNSYQNYIKITYVIEFNGLLY